MKMGMLRICAALCICLCSQTAWAGFTDEVELGLSFDVSMGSSYSGGFEEQSVVVEGATFEDPPYDGWWGFGAGAGVLFDARAWQWVGVEIGAVLSKDNGEADYEGATMKASNLALHLPVSVKLTLPARGLRPVFLLGLEFVVPLKTESSYEGSRLELSAAAEPYTLLSTGLGFELDLPIEGVDLRVPFAFRLGVNLAQGETVLDRATYSNVRGSGPARNITTAVFSTEFDAHLAFTTGLSWYFR